MTFKRRKIREVAFQTLFAMASDPEVDREQLYKELLPLAPQEEVPAYLEELVTGVSEHQAEFDQEIEGSLAAGWSLSRMEKPNLIILRLALYEMKYVDDVPVAVAIDEALEMTKKFSDDKSRKFINGVLGHIGGPKATSH
ncbi:transcription antitermination factor NusB [Limosilactobacillus fermentum]|uniref:transcription antitermination factor NusB n=1 Tax=Limosilactobacillus fermentum TaxID=1613 RepID=UPI0021E7B7A3|nr:transcription antitermination factor NusB [Limosilactobacillus fermentum]MCV3754422.1 transcription antitermination factor NusB [Limosilactobacillus fermentum]